MLALSPPLFSSNGWLFDDSISHQQLPQQQQADYSQHYFSGIPKELLSPPQQLQFYFSQPSGNHAEQLDDRFDPVTPSPKASSGDPSMVKKLNHNASERDRRRKVNDLYSSLRTLLPVSDQTKRLSIPATVSRVLKYIPELQHQVQNLARKKEELLMRVPSNNDTKDDGPSTYHRGRLGRQQKTNSNASPEAMADERRFVSANWLGEREITVHISAQKETEGQLLEILLNLERDGFSLINASTFESFGDKRVFYSLHVQAAKRTNAMMDCDKLKEKILCLCRKSDDIFPRRPGVHE